MSHISEVLCKIAIYGLAPIWGLAGFFSVGGIIKEKNDYGEVSLSGGTILLPALIVHLAALVLIVIDIFVCKAVSGCESWQAFWYAWGSCA